MDILNSSGYLDETIIEALEQVWGVGLPKAYKEFLTKYNGGSPIPNCFSFKNRPNEGSFVDVFFGVKKDPNNNLLMNIKLYEERIPSNFLPIADDPGGNLILLSIKGIDRGKIYFWDHDLEADPDLNEIPDYSNLILIADSFDEFINGLHSEDEIEEKS